jgi:hypothetical protein
MLKQQQEQQEQQDHPRAAQVVVELQCSSSAASFTHSSSSSSSCSSHNGRMITAPTFDVTHANAAYAWALAQVEAGQPCQLANRHTAAADKPLEVSCYRTRTLVQLAALAGPSGIHVLCAPHL